jgi:L-seryl-tRNA(Ser) seleniumtransferase
MAQQMIKRPRDFPAVETLLQSKEMAAALNSVPRPIAASIVKDVVAEQKRKLSKSSMPLTLNQLHGIIRERLGHEASARITRIINATGIVVHTNLGRAPLSESIFKDIQQTVVGAGNVEFDLRTGKRGSRGIACERYLASLSGAEAGTVVNNNAAALFIILNTLAARRKVLISRGELVQIGGGFRIPDILRRSGAKLAEVGTTNITSLADYESGIDDKTGLVLKVHKSNFVQAGFTEEVALKPLVALGKKHSIPVVNDLGSGVFVSTRKTLGYHEPTVQESVRAGADLTCFSGDKLLGGMQAGLIAGRRELVDRIKKNPIFRTVRVDKVVFSILEKLLASYLNGTHMQDIKLWQLLERPLSELRQMASKVLKLAGDPDGVKIVKTPAYVGGGSMPEQAIPSVGLEFDPSHKATRMMTLFRRGPTPIIGRIEDECFILDMKAIDPADLSRIARATKKALK